jgi:cell division GTPase FtsZ
MQTAEEGIEYLTDMVDTLIVIPNQRLLEVVDKKMTFIDAFRLADNVLGQGVKGISDLITVAGMINVDFADVKTIMSDSGTALMGIGEASGEDRAVMAARMAISSPLLEVSINGAKGILYNITGGPDMTMTEVSDASSIIGDSADADADIIFGATIDEDMGSKIKISVIATGFNDNYVGTGPRALFGAYGRESKRKMGHGPIPIRNTAEEEEVEENKIDRAPEAFTQPQTVADRKPKKEEKAESNNPFVRSALFNLKKDSKQKEADQSDKKEDAEGNDEFSEFEVPAFLRQK